MMYDDDDDDGDDDGDVDDDDHDADHDHDDHVHDRDTHTGSTIVPIPPLTSFTLRHSTVHHSVTVGIQGSSELSK